MASIPIITRSHRIHQDLEVDNLFASKSVSSNNLATSTNVVPPLSQFIPQGVSKNVIPTIAQVQQFVTNVCSYYDDSADASILFLPKLSSTIFANYIFEFSTFVGFDTSIFIDITSNMSVLVDYSAAMNAQIALIVANTTAPDNFVFGPPTVGGLLWNLNPNGYTGANLATYQTLRVLYTAFTLIGFFYQHHHIPFWIPPYQASMSVPSYYIPYSSTAPNQFSIPTVNCSQGVDCTNFTSIVYYLALGLYFSSDTIEQTCGNFAELNTWMNTPAITSILTAVSEADYGKLGNNPLSIVLLNSVNKTIGQSPPVLYVGAVVTSSPNVPLQSFNSSTTQAGDTAYLSTVSSSSTASTVTHGVINLGWPYIIDSDNFTSGPVTGVFVRNVQKIQAAGTLPLFSNIFLMRRFIGQTGQALPLTVNPATATAASITALSVQV